MAVDLDVLAAAAATTLARAVVTDGWEQVRRRLGKLLGRGNRDCEAAALAELDRVTAVDGPREPLLRRLVGACLAADPACAAGIEVLIDELRAPGRRPLLQTGHAGPGGLVIQAGRDVTIGPSR
jgi:hypothetical protein